MNWSSAERILYHIGDAPCHGTEFHNCSGDSYPAGDIHGLQARDLLTKLDSLQIKYYFGKIKSATDKMISRFNEIIGKPYVTTTSMTATTMISTMSRSISASIGKSLSTSRSIGGSEKLRAMVLNPVEPLWSTLTPLQALRYRTTFPTSIEEIKKAMDDKCISDFPESTLISLKKAPNPFATGASRASYYAQVQPTAGRASKAVILKEFMAEKASHRGKDRHEQNMSCATVAAFLAKEFNRVKPAGCPAIQYCEAQLLQFNSLPEAPFLAMEDRIDGTFEKYNANNGFCQPFPTECGTDHTAVQAFSHWTHHFSDGYLMVVDCQGAYKKGTNTFELTDPAIHSTASLRFGGNNLAQRGFNRFFQTHRCNDTCRALGLPEPKK